MQTKKRAECANTRLHFADPYLVTGPGTVVLDNSLQPTEPEPGISPDMHDLRFQRSKHCFSSFFEMTGKVAPPP